MGDVRRAVLVDRQAVLGLLAVPLVSVVAWSAAGSYLVRTATAVLAAYVLVRAARRHDDGLGRARRFFAASLVVGALSGLLAALSFDALELGRPLGLSDVHRILQSVPGVSWVDVDELGFADPAEQAARAFEPGPLQPRLAVFPARPDRDAPMGVRPGELLRVANATAAVSVTATGGLAG
ncbi:MAG TPA: hypothetical protein VFR56_05750 [Actinomycetes bacterium]|nr:hypothetical protein [Actinomycetes bacterium]